MQTASLLGHRIQQLVGITFILLCSLSLPAYGADIPLAGTIRSVIGAPDLHHPEKGSRKAVSGESIFVGDRITNNSSSRLVLQFTDGSNLHVGPSTRITVTEYLYDGKGNVLRNLLDLARGQVRLWTSKRYKEESIQFRTRNAVAGVRGTTVEMVYWRWLHVSMVGVLDGEAVIRHRAKNLPGDQIVKPDQCGWVFRDEKAFPAIPLKDAPNFFSLLGDGSKEPTEFKDPWASSVTDPRFREGGGYR